jgi:DNA-binding MarR family transcriptional regulator
VDSSVLAQREAAVEHVVAVQAWALSGMCQPGVLRPSCVPTTVLVGEPHAVSLLRSGGQRIFAAVSELHELPVAGSTWAPPCPAVQRLRDCVFRPYQIDFPNKRLALTSSDEEERVARHYGCEKIELRSVLELIAGAHPEAGELVTQITEVFGCAERAAKDALSILKRGSFVETTSGAPDRRRRHYEITERGWAALDHPNGALLLRFARKLYTTCPSRRGLTNQRWLAAHGELDATFDGAERLLLHFNDPSSPFHPITNPDPSTLASLQPVTFLDSFTEP